MNASKRSTRRSDHAQTSPPRSGAVGRVSTVLLGGLALGAALLAAAASLPSARTSAAAAAPAAASSEPAPLAAAELAGLLSRIGLAPEPLAAAGVTAAQAADLVAAAREHLEEDDNLQVLRAAEAAVAEARSEADRLARLIRGGKGSGGDADALQTARTALAAAQTAADAALAQLFGAAAGQLGGGQIAALQTIRVNSPRQLPTRYLAQERSEQQWLELRDALAHRRIALRDGDDLCPDANAVCLQADSDSAAAHTNLQTLLHDVRSAWDAAAGL